MRRVLLWCWGWHTEEVLLGRRREQDLVPACFVFGFHSYSAACMHAVMHTVICLSTDVLSDRGARPVAASLHYSSSLHLREGAREGAAWVMGRVVRKKWSKMEMEKKDGRCCAVKAPTQSSSKSITAAFWFRTAESSAYRELTGAQHTVRTQMHTHTFWWYSEC